MPDLLDEMIARAPGGDDLDRMIAAAPASPAQAPIQPPPPASITNTDPRSGYGLPTTRPPSLGLNEGRAQETGARLLEGQMREQPQAAQVAAGFPPEDRSLPVSALHGLSGGAASMVFGAEPAESPLRLAASQMGQGSYPSIRTVAGVGGQFLGAAPMMAAGGVPGTIAALGAQGANVMADRTDDPAAQAMAGSLGGAVGAIPGLGSLPVQIGLGAGTNAVAAVGNELIARGAGAEPMPLLPQVAEAALLGGGIPLVHAGVTRAPAAIERAGGLGRPDVPTVDPQAALRSMGPDQGARTISQQPTIDRATADPGQLQRELGQPAEGGTGRGAAVQEPAPTSPGDSRELEVPARGAGPDVPDAAAQAGPRGRGDSAADAGAEGPVVDRAIAFRDAKPTDYSRADIRRRIEGHEAASMRDDANAAADARLAEEDNTGVGFTFAGKIPTEIRDWYKAAPPYMRKLVREGDPNGRGQDFFEAVGADEFMRRAEETARGGRGTFNTKKASLRATDDPNAHLLAWLDENTKGGKRPDQIIENPTDLPIGASFTIAGQRFHVTDTNYGNEPRLMVRGPGFEALARDLRELPIDRDSYTVEDFAPEPAVELPFSPARDVAGQGGIFGQGAYGAGGKQGGLFGEQPKASKPPESIEPARNPGETDAQFADRVKLERRFEPARQNTGKLFGSPPRSKTVGAPGGSHNFAHPTTMSGTGKADVTAPDIIKAMEDTLGVPVFTGHGRHRLRKAAGWYRYSDSVIRNQSANDLATAAHEFGHAIHDRILSDKTGPRAVKAELSRMGRDLYGSRKPNGGYRREGMAEYIALRFLGDDVAKSAPVVHKWFNDQMVSNPEFAASVNAIEGMYKKWRDQGAVGRVAASIEFEGKGPVNAASRAMKTLRSALDPKWWVNDARHLERATARAEEQVGRPLRPTENPATMRAALQRTAPGTARYFLTKAAVNTKGTVVGPSLVEALRPVKDNLRDFSLYITARRGLDLHGRGINPGPAPRDLEFTVKALETPERRAAAEAVTKYADAVMDYVVESGGMSPAAAKAMRALNPIYVPFQRVFDQGEIAGGKGTGTGKGAANLPNATRKIKGSGRRIYDPINAIVLQTEKMISLANKARVGRSLADLADKPRMGWLASKVEPDITSRRFTLADIESQLKALNIDLQGADLDAVLSLFSAAERVPAGKQNIVSLWRKGEQELWEIRDPELYRVLTDMDREYLPKWATAVFGAPKRMVQLGATGLNPNFAVKNAIRDTMTWNLFNKTGAVDPLVAIRGLAARIARDPAAERWQAMGGEMSTLMGQDRRLARRAVEEHLPTSIKGKAVQTAKHPIDAARAAIGAFEASPRIIEYRNVLKQAEAKHGAGTEDAYIESLLASKDVTTDFTRSGIVIQVLNQLVPFLNASVQGVSKISREFRTRPVEATIRATAGITIPSLALWYLNKDEEWYKELPRYERGAYWHFRPVADGPIIRLPKPFELGHVFGSVPEAAMDSAYRKDSERVSEAAFDALASFLPVGGAPDMAPALLAPALEAGANYDYFRKRAIVPQGEAENRPPAEQFSKYTTETAKAIGRLLNVSPRKVEHLISGYTGGLGLDAMRLADSVAGYKQGETRAQGIPLIGSVLAHDPTETGQADSIVRFYDALNGARQAAGADGATMIQKSRARQMERIAREMAEARKSPGGNQQGRLIRLAKRGLVLVQGEQ